MTAAGSPDEHRAAAESVAVLAFQVEGHRREVEHLTVVRDERHEVRVVAQATGHGLVGSGAIEAVQDVDEDA